MPAGKADSDAHALLLRRLAPGIVEEFRNDPVVADFLDAAVWISAKADRCVAQIVERLQILELAARIPQSDGSINVPCPKGAPIQVLVCDASGASAFHVPDHRINPDYWPWSE